MSLVAVICDHAMLGVMAAVRKDAVDQFMRETPNAFDSDVGGRYSLCVMGVLTALGNKLAKDARPEAVHYIFEEGDDRQRHASRILNDIALTPELRQRFRYGGHSFLPKTAFPHFQAADLLAWEWQQHFKSPDTKPRASLDTLIKCVRHVHTPYGGPRSIGVQAIVNGFYGLGGAGGRRGRRAAR